MDEPEALLALQEVDSSIDRLRYRRENLPEASVLREKVAALSAIDARRGEIRERTRQAERSQKESEAELAALTGRIQGLDKQMYSGTVSAAKDLQAMAHEVAQLKERAGQIEETVLEHMEQVETLGKEMATVDGERAAVEESIEKLKLALDEARASVDLEIEIESRSRAEKTALIGPELSARYEALRQKLGGVAVAPLVSGRCEGCHLALSVVALDRIRHAPEGSLPTCEECGRILVQR